jgi:hypothetical protein
VLSRLRLIDNIFASDTHILLRTSPPVLGSTSLFPSGTHPSIFRFGILPPMISKVQLAVSIIGIVGHVSSISTSEAALYHLASRRLRTPNPRLILIAALQLTSCANGW